MALRRAVESIHGVPFWLRETKQAEMCVKLRAGRDDRRALAVAS